MKPSIRWLGLVALLGSLVGCGESKSNSSEAVASSSAALTDCSGLPNWVVRSYVAGERVQHRGVAFECKGWPYTGWCASAGYEPGVTSYWADAWIQIDTCAGPVGTQAPTGDTVNEVTGQCPENAAECCPQGYDPVVLSSGPNTYQTGSGRKCVVGLAGTDTIAAQGGNHVVLGGADTDTFQAASGDNFVVPGPGVDIVALGTGNDTVFIFDLCELSWGDTVDMGTGTDTLIAPLPLAELQARGLNIANVDNVVVQQNSCRSECVEQPDCNGHGHCGEGGAPGEVKCVCDEGYSGEHCEILCAGPLAADFDGDGVPGCLDACPADPNKTQPGVCLCNTPDTDSDGDGIADCHDLCINDATNADCPQDGKLDPPLALPWPPGHTTVQLPPAGGGPGSGPGGLNCVPESGVLTQPVPQGATPTEAQLAALQGVAPLTAADCSPAVQDLHDCALDPNQLILNAPCNSDDDCDFFIELHCAAGIPSECATMVEPLPDFCRERRNNCGLALEEECARANQPPISGCNIFFGNDDCPACSFEGQLLGKTCGCDEVTVCPIPGYTGDSGPQPGAYTLVPQTDPPAALVDARQDDPPTEYVDAADPTSCPNNDCTCKLGMDLPPPIPGGDNKTGDHGEGSLLTVTFNPDVHFNVDLDPLPFGEADFLIDAGASFTGRAQLSLLGQNVNKSIVDIAAGVKAGRCALSTASAHFKLFDVDFVDLFDSEPIDTFEKIELLDPTEPPPVSDPPTPLEAASYACQDAVTAFVDAGDRAKKALRDAQALLKLYDELPDDTTFDRTSFCEAMGEIAEPGFPAINCLTTQVEDTINAHVDYYKSRVDELGAKQQDLLSKSAAFLGEFQSVEGRNAIRFLGGDERRHSSRVATIQFFVGPVPVLITVDVGVGYGITGDLVYELSPMNALGLTLDQPARLASVAGEIKPKASAVVMVFAGVGFDVPGFSIKAGVTGELSLAAVTATLRAGAGLSLKATEDKRNVPDDLLPFTEGAPLMAPRYYSFYADWFFSAKAGLTDVLSGHLDAMVELKALFFRKRFRKTFLSFESPFNFPEITLIQAGDTIGDMPIAAPALDKNALGAFEMQLPFVNLRKVSVPQTPQANAEEFVLPETTVLHFNKACLPEPPK
jgi:hypothetical protein